MAAANPRHRRELVDLLSGYDAPADEAATLAEMRRLAAHPADVFAAATCDPGHFTVSGFVTDAPRTRVVLVLHRRVGAWLQPGGHVESSDTSLWAALMRELDEETGLSALTPGATGLFDIDVHGVPAHGGQPAHRHLDLRFHLMTEEETLQAHPGGDEVRWAPLDAIEAWTNDVSVLRAVRKLRSQHGGPLRC